MNFQELWAFWTSTHASALPAPALAAAWMRLGWGLVIAVPLLAVLNAMASKWHPAFRHCRLPAIALAILWCLLPGTISPAYWLGLAFQLPSILTVAICLFILAENLIGESPRAAMSAGHSWRSTVCLLAPGILLGWILLLDTLALLPMQFYILGWSPAAVAVAVFVSALLISLCGQKSGTPLQRRWALPLALLVFVVLRLPTGNVWDAILDPGLWVALHIYALSALLRRRRAGARPVA